MIPKIIQIHWFFDSMPHWVEKAINAYREFFPDWDVRVYTEIPSDMPEEYLDVMRQAPHSRLRADLIRWWLLYRDGGIYVDADTLPAHDFSPLLEHKCFFARLGMSPKVDIFFVGAEPELPLFKEALENAKTFRDGAWPNTYFYIENLVPDVRKRDEVTVLSKRAVYESKREFAHKFLETDVANTPPRDPKYLFHFCNFRARTGPLRPSLLEEQADKAQEEWLRDKYGEPKPWRNPTPQGNKPPIGVSMTKMPNGDLLCDPGGPRPEKTPEGYVQDSKQWFRFHPVSNTT